MIRMTKRFQDIDILTDFQFLTANQDSHQSTLLAFINVNTFLF